MKNKQCITFRKYIPTTEIILKRNELKEFFKLFCLYYNVKSETRILRVPKFFSSVTKTNKFIIKVTTATKLLS